MCLPKIASIVLNKTSWPGLSRLQKEEMRLTELNLKLKLELATLRSPQYLEEATQTLGLREASPEQIVVLP